MFSSHSSFGFQAEQFAQKLKIKIQHPYKRSQINQQANIHITIIIVIIAEVVSQIGIPNKKMDLSAKTMKTDVKPASEGVLTTVTRSKMKCLDRIFDSLNLKEFLSVAASNTILQQATALTYKQKYGDKVLRIGSSKNGMEFSMDGVQLKVTDVQNLLLMFGDLIPSIEIQYPVFKSQIQRKIFEKIFDAILKHSLKGLNKIAFIKFPEGWLNKFSRPLQNVESATFDRCYLDDKDMMLSNIFPRLCHLKVICRQAEHNQIIAHFPHLKTLKLMMRDNQSIEFMSLLDLNQQLQAFELKSNNNWKLVHFIGERSMLESFDFHCCLPAKRKRYHFKQLKHFRYFGSYMNKFPFTFDQLESLTLDLELNINQIDDIIKQNDKLTDVTLCNIKNVRDINTSNELGKISRIAFKVDRLEREIDDIVKFLDDDERCFARKINFEGASQSFRIDLQKKINRPRKWCFESNKDKLILELAIFKFFDKFCKLDNNKNKISSIQ